MGDYPAIGAATRWRAVGDYSANTGGPRRRPQQPAIRRKLWPFLVDGGADRAPAGSRGGSEALERLMESRESIQLNLAELRRKVAEETPNDG